MPILMVHESPGGSQELYDKVIERLSGGKGFASPEDWPVAGLRVHTAGPVDGGWRVVDVWESAEAFEQFGQVIVPVLQEVGFPGEPRVYPLHNYVD